MWTRRSWKMLLASSICLIVSSVCFLQANATSGIEKLSKTQIPRPEPERYDRFHLALSKIIKFLSSEGQSFYEFLLNRAQKFQLIEEAKTKKRKTSIDTVPNSPIILIPGYGGSKLFGQLDETVIGNATNMKDCSKFFKKRRNVWVNPYLLLPAMIDCMIYMMSLRYDPETRFTSNNIGVQIEVAKKLEGLDNLSDLLLSSTTQCESLSTYLETKLGYDRNVDLLGAPYDFRRAPNEQGAYFNRLAKTIEDAHSDSSGAKITLVCHSMGCRMMLFFLQQRDQQWKDKYIRRLVTLGAPWGGSVSMLKALLTGQDLGMPQVISSRKMAVLQRTMPSSYFLFPLKEVYGDQPLLITHLMTLTPSMYQAADMDKFLESIGQENGLEMLRDTLNLRSPIDPPGVEVWCVAGISKPTIVRLEYEGDPDRSRHKAYKMDGDGTVDIISGSFCKQWASRQEQPVYFKELEANHMGLLDQQWVFDLLAKFQNDSMSSELPEELANLQVVVNVE